MTNWQVLAVFVLLVAVAYQNRVTHEMLLTVHQACLLR
jgi:hypothetical protein